MACMVQRTTFYEPTEIAQKPVIWLSFGEEVTLPKVTAELYHLIESGCVLDTLSCNRETETMAEPNYSLDEVSGVGVGQYLF